MHLQDIFSPLRIKCSSREQKVTVVGQEERAKVCLIDSSRLFICIGVLGYIEHWQANRNLPNEGVVATP